MSHLKSCPVSMYMQPDEDQRHAAKPFCVGYYDEPILGGPFRAAMTSLHHSPGFGRTAGLPDQASDKAFRLAAPCEPLLTGAIFL